MTRWRSGSAAIAAQHRQPVVGLLVRASLGHGLETRGPAPFLGQADVDDGSPEPAGQTFEAPKLATRGQCTGEGFLHCVTTGIHVAENGDGEPEEATKFVAVRLLDRSD